MGIRFAHTPDGPFRDQPGRCPRCGVEVRLRVEEIFPIGMWDGRNADGRRAGGIVFGANCRQCGVELKTYEPKSALGDSSAVRWYTDGGLTLIGGDRWRGRPGASSTDDEPQHESRLRELTEGLGSMDEAIKTLHAAAGLGALHLSRLVERVAGLSAEEAKRVVVRALAPDCGMDTKSTHRIVPES